MSKKEKTVRAWKDPQFRAGLTPDEKKNLPEHPAGDGALDDDDLEKAAGGWTFRWGREVGSVR